MGYRRGDAIARPPSRSEDASSKKEPEAAVGADAHILRAKEIEPQAIAHMKNGELYKALELFADLRLELADALECLGPGSDRTRAIKDAKHACEQNMAFVKSYSPYEF